MSASPVVELNTDLHRFSQGPLLMIRDLDPDRVEEVAQFVDKQVRQYARMSCYNGGLNVGKMELHHPMTTLHDHGDGRWEVRVDHDAAVKNGKAWQKELKALNQDHPRGRSFMGKAAIAFFGSGLPALVGSTDGREELAYRLARYGLNCEIQRTVSPPRPSLSDRMKKLWGGNSPNADQPDQPAPSRPSGLRR